MRTQWRALPSQNSPRVAYLSHAGFVVLLARSLALYAWAAAAADNSTTTCRQADRSDSVNRLSTRAAAACLRGQESGTTRCSPAVLSRTRPARVHRLLRCELAGAYPGQRRAAAAAAAALRPRCARPGAGQMVGGRDADCARVRSAASHPGAGEIEHGIRFIPSYLSGYLPGY